jgi:hypothetical protein
MIRVTVDPKAHEYAIACVKSTESEVGGIGYVECLEPGEFYIHKFVLLEQTSSMASVDIEGSAYIEEITKAGDADKLDQLRLNWHSHPGMSVYFSKTDDRGIEEYAACGTPWLLSLVFNEKEEVASRLDIFDNDLVGQISIEGVKYEVPQLDSEIAKQAQEDVKRLVKEPPVRVVKYRDKDKKQQQQEDHIISPLYDDDFETPPWISPSYNTDVSDDDEEDWAALEEEFGAGVVELWKREEEIHRR